MKRHPACDLDEWECAAPACSCSVIVNNVLTSIHGMTREYNQRRSEMATKKQVMEEAARGEGCLGKAKDDEPVFVLVGDDALAAGTIGFWITRLQNFQGSRAKIEGANRDLEQFQLWAAKHGTKIPD